MITLQIWYVYLGINIAAGPYTFHPDSLSLQPSSSSQSSQVPRPLSLDQRTIDTGHCVASTKMKPATSFFLAALAAPIAIQAAFTWKNVHIGGGGGFVPSIIFHPKSKGLAYARTDLGGLYRLNSDDSWTPVTDANNFADDENWRRWGIDAVALDPQDSAKVFAAVGMYTNSWSVSGISSFLSLSKTFRVPC